MKKVKKVLCYKTSTSGCRPWKFAGKASILLEESLEDFVQPIKTTWDPPISFLDSDLTGPESRKNS